MRITEGASRLLWSLDTLTALEASRELDHGRLGAETAASKHLTKELKTEHVEVDRVTLP